MHTWYDYRAAWSGRPWVLAIFVVAAALLVAGIVGTVTMTPLALLFIPGLAAVFGHHLLVTRKYG